MAEPSIEVTVERAGTGWVATVRVRAAPERTEHRVAVAEEDLVRYGATDAADLVRRSFGFLLEREPAGSILRDFRITEIERYFPEFAAAIRGEGR
jgi:hypothetical protein